MRPFTALRKVIKHYGSNEGAKTATIYLRGEYGETRECVGMAFPRRLLRGRCEMRTEASWASGAVASVEKMKTNQHEIQKRTMIGLTMGQADAISLTLSRVQKLITN